MLSQTLRSNNFFNVSLSRYPGRICSVAHLTLILINIARYIFLMQESKLSLVCEKVLDRCLAPSTVGGEGYNNMTMISVQFEKPIQSGATSDEKPSLSEEAQVDSEPAETDES
ncbi:UNVERIFIED_CONTAM: putative protein phosphatase 2C 11 [Sesamum indicum]